MDREVGKRIAPRTRQEPRTQIALLWEKLGELEERIKELEAPRHDE